MQEAKAEASRIVVDHQVVEFNDAQKVLSDMYATTAGIEFANGPGLPKLEFDGMPSTPVAFMSTEKGASLELVDVMLWIHRRLDEEVPVANAPMPLVRFNAPKGQTDELSLVGLHHRWGPELSSVSDIANTPPERIAEVRAIMGKDNARVKAALEACGQRPL